MQFIRCFFGKLLIALFAVLALSGCGQDKPGAAPWLKSSKMKMTPAASIFIEADASKQQKLTTPDGRVEVVVPVGAFTAPDELVVSTVEADLPALAECFDTVALFDISAKQQNTFEKPLQITFSYAESGLRNTDRPSALKAAWWNEHSGSWLSAPVTVDASARTVTMEMTHLTLFGWFMEKRGYERRTLGAFEVIWDKKALTPPKNKADRAAWDGKIMYKSANDADKYSKAAYVKDKSLPKIVRDLGAYLNHALKQYKDAEWKMPDTPISVVIETSLTSENMRDKALGIIHIGEYNTSSSQLKTAAGHELFHAIQNEYLWSIGGMTFLGWFCESTAEYAGSIVWGTSQPTRRVPPKYFSERLDSEKNEHEYHSAHFINHLVGPGSTEQRLRSLRKLWTGTLDNHGVTDALDILYPMHQFLSKSGGGGLNRSFKDHVYEVCFGANSPMSSGTSPSSNRPPVEMAEGWALLKANETSAPGLIMMLKGNRRAKVWAVRAQMPDKQKTRPVKLTVKGELHGNITATAHVLAGGARSSRAVKPRHFFTDAQREVNLVIAEDDAVYVVVINTGGRAAELSLKVEQGEASMLDALHMCNSFLVSLSATHPNGYKEKIIITCENVRWHGTTFTADFSEAGQKAGLRTTDTRTRVSGSVSADCSQLRNLRAQKSQAIVTKTPKGPYKRVVDKEMHVGQLPLTGHDTAGSPYFRYTANAPLKADNVRFITRNTDSDGVLETGLDEIFLKKGELAVSFSTR
ncbi:MAG TPA: hypothetical protein ENN40_04845 [Candidatus Aminicenantes bacterium]|nr:hypothetical protein [Candidatus Aminicenantes bacterium]